MIDRRGIIVYLTHLKQAKSLRKYGHIQYISKRMKYAVLYCNMEDADRTAAKLERLPYVKSVSLSMKPFIKTEYENAKPDKAKEYDYKGGI
ncbi:YlbG family protein [Bhargavaea cecembensis]|uniref:YlbG family protein n=1 Tax=Bhargavaea cecembensis TaxID=394098 RepID=UPI00058FCB48|nr:YlbG family protein [Bhargavaea cecembensis]